MKQSDVLDHMGGVALVVSTSKLLYRVAGRPSVMTVGKHSLVGAAGGASLGSGIGYAIGVYDNDSDPSVATAVCAGIGAYTGALLGFTGSLVLSAFRR